MSDISSRWQRPSSGYSHCCRAAIAALVVLPGMNASGQPSASSTQPTIVLEHGAWADGSSWDGVVHRLQNQGFTVLVPPDPLRGPVAGGDSAYLASYLAKIPGPIVLVGHSYGGMVITDAAVGNPNVKALVYVDAFIPDAGQPLGALTSGSCLAVDTTKSFKQVPVPGGVDLYVQIAPNPPYIGFAQCFANGVPPAEAAVLAVSQRPHLRSRPLRPVRAAGVEDNPLVVADRDTGPGHPPGPAASHVESCPRPH